MSLMITPTEAGKRHLSNRDLEFLNHVAQELCNARQHYPDTTHLALAAMEEVGEAAQAIYDYEHAGAPEQAVWNECVQAATMMMRLGVEGIQGMSYYYGPVTP